MRDAVIKSSIRLLCAERVNATSLGCN